MTVRPARLADVAGFSIDKVAAAAGDDPDVLRLENLDTDLAPPHAAVEATKAAVDDPSANSYLPFTGRSDLRHAVADRVRARSGVEYDPESEVVITSSDGDGLLDALLAVTDPGDEVIITDPTYAGILNRVLLAGARPRVVPMRAIRAHGDSTSKNSGRPSDPPRGRSCCRIRRSLRDTCSPTPSGVRSFD